MTEFARDAYSRNGQSLLDTIAVVHPCIISTLMKRVESAVGSVGEVRGGEGRGGEGRGEAGRDGTRRRKGGRENQPLTHKHYTCFSELYPAVQRAASELVGA